MNRGHVCAIRGAHSRTRDCDAVAKRFEFLPPPSSPSLPLSVSFRSPATGETGGVCTRARRIVSDVAGDICWLAFGRDYPNLLGFPLSLSLPLFELQQVQFTSIGTKRMQKWIGRHERAAKPGERKKGRHNGGGERRGGEGDPVSGHF